MICCKFRASRSNRVCRVAAVVDGFSCKLIRRAGRDSLAALRATTGAFMRPKERRQTGQSDLFRARLDQIVDLDHRDLDAVCLDGDLVQMRIDQLTVTLVL